MLTKTMRAMWSLLFFAALALTACHKDKEKPMLSVDKTTINATNAASKEYIQINSNTDWSINAIPAWIKVSPSSGHGDTKVEFSFDANIGVDSRNTGLSINANGVNTPVINVTQMGAAPSLLVDKSTLEEKAEGQQDSIVITSNVPWKLEIPAEATWITTTDPLTGAAGVNKVHFSVAVNAQAKSLNTILKVSGTGATVDPVNVAVNQAQQDVVINTFTLRAKGGETITITGSGFSATAADNKVKINNVNAIVTTASATSLAVTVPMKAGTGSIVVNVGEESATSTTSFTYDWVWMVSTYAGTGAIGANNGSSSLATFYGPQGITVDGLGNVYVSEYYNELIRKIDPSGVVNTLAGKTLTAGSAYGTGTNATFYHPVAVAVDNNGNIYVADFDNKIIRKISTSGEVNTWAGQAGVAGSNDGPGSTATFRGPEGIAVDKDGNVYVADGSNHLIRKISPAGIVSTIAGKAMTPGTDDGIGANATFNGPHGLAVDKDGNVYVADFNTHLIRKILPSGLVTTLAGKKGVSGADDGIGSNATFFYPSDLTVDNEGNVYVCEWGNSLIRKITPAGEVTTLAGQKGKDGANNGPAKSATFYAPSGIEIDKDGNLFIADFQNQMIRKMSLQ